MVFLLFSFLLGSSVHAQMPELAKSEFVRSDVRACAYSKFLGSYLDSLSDDEIAIAVSEQSEKYSSFVMNDETILTKNEYKLRKKIQRDFQAIARSRNARSILKNAAAALCTVGVTTGGVLVHETALAASVITSGFTFPIRSIAKFGIGLFTRKTDVPRGVGYGEFTGTGWDANLVGILFQTYKVAFASGNPFMLAFYGITAMDIALQEHCRGDAPKSDRSARFCQSYENIKKIEYDGTEGARRSGAYFGQEALLKLDFRGDAAANPGLCQKGFKKQIRVGKRARIRLIDQLTKDGMSSAKVLVQPPELNGCVSLTVSELTLEQEALINESYSGFIDGIPYTLHLKDEKVPAPEPTPAPDYSKDEDVCKAVYESQVVDFVSRPDTMKMKGEILKMTFGPARFGKLVSEDVSLKEEQLVSEPVEKIGTGKNIILIMAPSQSQLVEYEAVLPRLEELKEQMRIESAKLKWLKKSKTFETCMARQAVTEFDFVKFKELSEAIKKITVAKRIEEFRAMYKKASKAGRKMFGLRHSFKLDWEIVELNSLNVLRDTLRDPELLNLILVSHGNENGKMVDSRFNELATTAFESIQPNLQSISFFSCHSVEAPKTYFMNEQMATHASYHQIRSVNHVLSSALLEESNEAPVLALNTFIDSVDRQAYRSLRGNARVQMAFSSKMKKPVETKMCSIRFENLEITQGAFSVKINQHWAGVIYSGESVPAMQAPCEWTSSSDLKVFLEGISLNDPYTIKSSEVKLKMETLTGELELRNPISKTRADGSVSRLTWGSTAGME